MGSYISANLNEPQASEGTDPTKADWITAHATSTGLAVVEVERLWLRFQQLGCNGAGVLREEAFQGNEAGQDIFAKNILTTMKSRDGSITFETFLNGMKWAENASLDHKIRGVFKLLNNGGVVNKDMLVRILSRLYPDDNPAAIERTANIFMEQIDKRGQGSVDEEQFAEWVKTMPGEGVSKILAFHIIPPEINLEAHRTFTSFTNYTTQNSVRDPMPPSGINRIDEEPDISQQIPTDGMLQQVANRVQHKDWHVLANRLAFTATDIQQFERRYSGDTEEQVLQMLKAWRQREGTNAYVGELETALRDSKMNDVAMLLQP